MLAIIQAGLLLSNDCLPQLTLLFRGTFVVGIISTSRSVEGDLNIEPETLECLFYGHAFGNLAICIALPYTVLDVCILYACSE